MTTVQQQEAIVQKITTFLTFNDQAEAAVNLYVSTFKHSRILSATRYGEAGPGPAGSLMTCEFELEGQKFVALNGGPSFSFAEGISLFVSCETQAEVDEPLMPLGEYPWSPRYGWIQDRFGVSWQVMPTALGEMLGDPDPAKAGRTMQAMLQMSKIDIAALRRAYAGH